MGKLPAYEKRMLASPDQQVSLTDPDSRSMATSGRGSGVVGYNAQVAVDTEHHLIITHEVTNSGSDRAQLANVANQAKAVLQTDTLDAVDDRGYFSSPQILACHKAGITVTLPKPMTSSAKSEGRFGRQDFVYIAEEDVYRCPAGERLTYRYSNEEAGKVLRRYWTTACSKCPLKSQCTTGPERRIARWEHEHLLDAVQHWSGKSYRRRSISIYLGSMARNTARRRVSVRGFSRKAIGCTACARPHEHVRYLKLLGRENTPRSIGIRCRRQCRAEGRSSIDQLLHG